MNGRTRFFGGLVFLLGLVVVAAAIGALAYNAGLAQGANQALSAEGAETVSPFFYGPAGIHRFGPISWLLFCLVVPFFFFLVFGAMKMIFAPWGMHRRYGWGWMGGPERKRRFEEMAEEWHRQAHAKEEGNSESEGDTA